MNLNLTEKYQCYQIKQVTQIEDRSQMKLIISLSLCLPRITSKISSSPEETNRPTSQSFSSSYSIFILLALIPQRITKESKPLALPLIKHRQIKEWSCKLSPASPVMESVTAILHVPQNQTHRSRNHTLREVGPYQRMYPHWIISNSCGVTKSYIQDKLRCST